jgi:integrase
MSPLRHLARDRRRQRRPRSCARGPTVQQAWEEYAATRQTPPDARERAIWQRFIEPTLGERRVAGLTTAELERWLAAQPCSFGARRLGRPLALADREVRRRAQYTANRRFNLLRAILNSAYRKDPDRIPSPEAWRRVRTFQRVEQPRTRMLDTPQCQRLLAVLPPALGVLARAALHTGCRLGELQTLRVEDISGDRVRVRHSKSGRARCVPLSTSGTAFFAHLTADRPNAALVFEPVSGIAVSRGMRAACKASAIEPPATFHDLRRTYGSILLNSGAPAHVVQELLGHADLRTTRRAYAHLTAETLRREVEAHLPAFD